MRDLVVTEKITLDGVIEATDGWFAPPDMEAALLEQRQRADASLVERVTFEKMRGYWPLQQDDPTGTADYLDAVAKYVVSSALDEPGWDNAHVLSRPLAEEIVAVKSALGRDILATGIISLVHQLLGAGLVDEVRLFDYPITLGTDSTLVAGESTSADLDLFEAPPVACGVVLLRYRVGSQR